MAQPRILGASRQAHVLSVLSSQILRCDFCFSKDLLSSGLTWRDLILPDTLTSITCPSTGFPVRGLDLEKVSDLVVVDQL